MTLGLCVGKYSVFLLPEEVFTRRRGDVVGGGGGGGCGRDKLRLSSIRTLLHHRRAVFDLSHTRAEGN